MVKNHLKLLAAALISCATTACGGGGNARAGFSGGEYLEVTKGIVIQNVSVVNTRDGSISRGMGMVIDEGKIQKIVGPSAFIRVGGTGRAIDGSGKYVVPGYLDMHTHALASADKNPTFWPLMIANGITGIREMSGSTSAIERARQINSDSSAGRLDAPEVLTITGDLFVGQTNTAAEAIDFVRRQKAAGAGFVKVVAGNRESVVSILEESAKQELHVAGHLVPAITAAESSQLGWRAIEHLGAGWGLALECANDEAAIRTTLLGGQARPPFPATFTLSPRLYDGTLNGRIYQSIHDSYSELRCQALAQTFVKNGTWHVPTLIRLRTQNFSDDPVYRSDPNLKYVDKTTRALWEKLGQEYASNVPPASAASLRRFYSLQMNVTRTLKQNGVKMLAGSDLGGIWVIPGFGLHQEFRELAASGLSPLDVLQMTTLNGAQFLNREATMGTVTEGKTADLVLLDANPVEDAANLGKIAGVILKGRYFAPEALEKMKADVAAAYQAQPLKPLEEALDQTHKH
ncbi:MAG: amidohydrolase family protein [Variovorax sp.]